MEHLSMHTLDIAESNIHKIGELFPNCLTERLNENGKVETAIDFDQLRQELSKDIVEGPQERYQFTWPDKRNAIRLANAPTTDTLRPCRDESVNFDTTQNLYIEGDNLQVLKLLRENYLGKVKMIYIDPPYNTGKDFIYRDDFSQTANVYIDNSGQTDESGNRLVQNAESNGRFHTNWLNMIYPRIKTARDLLSADGVIYISIDDNELDNLKKICDEIFGAENHVETFNIQVRYDNKSLNEKDDFQKLMEYVLIYTKNKHYFIPKKSSSQYDLSKFCYKITELSDGQKVILGGKEVEIFKDGEYRIEKVEDYGIQYLKATWASGSVLKGNTSGKFFDTQLSNRKDIDGLGVLYKVKGIGEDGLGYRYFTGPKKADATKGLFYSGVPLNKLEELKTGAAIKYAPIINFYNYSADFGNIRQEGGIAFNSGKKPVKMLKKLLEISNLEDSDIVMDFFSGSASTAHAVMQLNLEEGSHRKFIMVQIPEATDENSDAFKAGYKNICEIGKERIRRSGKKIKEESPLTTQDLDIGFRVLKLDSSNMEDVYYRPEDSSEATLFEDNVKPDRTGEDLLFQVMLECNLPLSAKIETEKISGKEVFSVNDGYLIACFDEKVNEDVIKEVAKRQPYYFVMRDSSLATDNVADNFEQIWKAYSKDTIRRII